jgi:hypothetical protein
MLFDMTSQFQSRSITRRAMLKTVAAAGIGSAFSGDLFGQSSDANAAWHSAVIAYLETLSRPDGGYAWADQEDAHLTPTFAVIGCYQLLKRTPPNKARLAEFVRTHHPSRLRKLEQEHRVFEFQQVQSLVWLDDSAADFRERVRRWEKPFAFPKQYEQHGYPVFQSETAAFTCRRLLQLPLEELSPHFIAYLDARRRTNGSFNNTPATEGGDGHVMNTWWGLRALRVLGRASERKQETIAWLRACQLPNGGFTWQPNAEFGGVDDAAYTWAAVRALDELGSAPADRNSTSRYLGSLWNTDGGFSDRPGWASNPAATYYALDALATLDPLGPVPTARKSVAPPRLSLPSDLKLFTIQIEAHGQGSPAEAVDLARALRIHLWGAKNAKPEWIARAQMLADQQNVPVKFFVANEEYGTWVTVPGLGTYSHTSDIIAPPAVDFGPPLAKAGAVSWPEFRQRRLAPLQKADGVGHTFSFW